MNKFTLIMLIGAIVITGLVKGDDLIFMGILLNTLMLMYVLKAIIELRGDLREKELYTLKKENKELELRELNESR